jgi:hypothetical protein
MTNKTPAVPVIEYANLKSTYREYAGKYANFSTLVKVLISVNAVVLSVVVEITSIHLRSL